MNYKRIEEMQAQITALQNELNTIKQLSQYNIPVTERIKTFRDACEVLGDEHPLVKEYWGVVNVELDITQDLIVYLKLRIIAAALNNGWTPTFTKDECRYFPYFELYTQEEYDCMDEEWKRQHPLLCWSDAADSCASCALVFADSDCDCALANAWAGIGFSLAVKSEELAIYFGTQFSEIWKDFVFRQSEE